MFNTLIAGMLIVVLGLFFFASRISTRILGLRNQAEAIIDDAGRVKNTIVPSQEFDEIGDLSRSFSSVVERLTQYTNYLENMSSRLSHELRTPVTVVRCLSKSWPVRKERGVAVYMSAPKKALTA